MIVTASVTMLTHIRSILVLIHFLINCVLTRDIVHGNNACKSFQDYLRADTSKNCFYNPDMVLETPDLIKKYINDFESYQYISEDGYIQTMFRLPRRNAKGVILLEHPLTTDSRIWMSHGNTSLALYLWKAGYDIWLNNNRGTKFSQKHKYLDTSDFRYWDFSFHEMGLYDIAEQVRLISKRTKDNKIIFIGHSMGSTAGLIYATMHPQESKQFVKAFILMGTPCYFKYSTSPAKYLTSLLEPIGESFPALLTASGHVIIFRNVLLIGTRLLLRLYPVLLQVIDVILSIFSGWTPKESDPAFLNFDVAINIKNFSWKTILHYWQIIHAETKFQMFDYGKRKNFKKYNSPSPPLYPIEDISVPILQVSSINDTLTTLQDSDLLYERLPQPAKVYGHLKLSGLNHFTYFTGKRRVEIYFEKLLNIIEKILIN